MVLGLLNLALACPTVPSLRDEDGSLTALSQNLKFITTGGRREERARLLGDWLGDEGRAVDLLLLSEARLTGPLVAELPDFCFYNQTPRVDGTYEWALLGGDTPPGGLVLGVRQRPEGVPRLVSIQAGARFRAAPATVVEGFLGRLMGYEKGWADLVVDGTRIVWSHTQASYRKRPDVGAGGAEKGRAGQFDDLAQDLGHPEHPTLLTGDLNLLDRFRRPDASAGTQAASEVDAETVERFERRTGLLFHLPRGWLDHDHRDDDGHDGTFLGGLWPDREEPVWDQGADYDRVGVNAAFVYSHPETKVRRVAIASPELRVSDHLGLLISIPFIRPGGPGTGR